MLILMLYHFEYEQKNRVFEQKSLFPQFSCLQKPDLDIGRGLLSEINFS
jgi:hypothetical protein